MAISNLNTKDYISVPSFVNDNHYKKRMEISNRVSHTGARPKSKSKQKDVFVSSRRKQRELERKKALAKKGLISAGAILSAVATLFFGAPKIEEAKQPLDFKAENVENSLEIINGIEEDLSAPDYIIPNHIINEEQENEQVSSVFDFECNLTQEQENSLNKFIENWNENKEIYKNIEYKTDVPAELIAAIHWREGGGDFKRCLQDGTPLGEEITSPLFEGKIYYSFEDSAVDVLKDKSLHPEKIEKGNFETYLDFAENYNGPGYKNQGLNSPYVWAGTEKYTSGKFVADGEFDPYHVDDQVGVAILLKHICTNN